jgi:putative FmdB family regulatory protein
VPTYQYACTECGEPVEAVQKFTDDPLTVCTNCGGRLRKVYSPVGIVFKGSGFYRTDSRKAPVATEDAGSKAAKSNGSGEGSAGDKKDAPASGSSESKPDGKKASDGKKKSGDTKAPASAGSGSGS